MHADHIRANIVAFQCTVNIATIPPALHRNAVPITCRYCSPDFNFSSANPVHVLPFTTSPISESDDFSDLIAWDAAGVRQNRTGRWRCEGDTGRGGVGIRGILNYENRCPFLAVDGAPSAR